MSFTALSDPSLLAAVGSRSYWLSSGGPLIWKFQRKDTNIISITNNSGTIKCTVSPMPTDVEVGDRVYISNVGYTGNTTIKSIGVGFIELNLIHLGNSSGGFINLIEKRNNYYIEAIIYELTPTAETAFATRRFYDNETGIVTMDLSETLDSKMVGNDSYNFTPINGSDTGKSFAFKFTTREQYRSETIDVSVITHGSLASAQAYFVVKSTKQLGALYGANLRDYMLDVAVDPVNETYVAKFMTGFERPTYFVGYPFTLSFLYTDHVSSKYLVRKEQEKDVNGVNVGAETSANLIYAPRTTINRLNNRKSYGGTIKAFQIWLEQGATINFAGGGYGTGIGGGGASTDYFAESYDENWGT